MGLATWGLRALSAGLQAAGLQAARLQAARLQVALLQVAGHRATGPQGSRLHGYRLPGCRFLISADISPQLPSKKLGAENQTLNLAEFWTGGFFGCQF